MDIILFLLGLIAIVKGADWLTDGAAKIACHFGIPTIVVGLTIVAMGSSMPEFVVSVFSAMKGNTDMALGNIVGSNIFNILAIIGITALVRPIKVDRANVRNDVPFAALSSVVVAITAFDSFFDFGSTAVALNTEPGGGVVEDSISRTDGLMMLCMFLIFMSYTLSIAKHDDIEDPEPQTGHTKELFKNIGLVIIGLALLILGGEWLVDGATGIATMMGIPQSIIALTIVSAGTSAPELAASVMAAKKGDTAMALGNVVGSVVFNVFFVLGSAAAICPLGIGGITSVDIMTLLGASVLLWLFCKFGKQYYTIDRMEGSVLVICMIAYYTYLVIAQ